MMNLIYQVVVVRGDQENTLILTLDRKQAGQRARDYNQSSANTGEAIVVAFIPGEHNWAYVDCNDSSLYQIDDADGSHVPVVGDFSFATIVARGEEP